MHPQAHNKAMIAALLRLEQVDVPDEERTFPTMRDLRQALPAMNEREFLTTFKNLSRRKKIRHANKVEVPYCTRKVAVLSLWVGDLPKTAEQQRESLALWQSMPVCLEPIAEAA